MAGTTQQNAAAKAAPKRDSIPFSWILVGVLLAFGGGYLYVTNTQTTAAPAPLQYLPDEIARDRPLHAVHEMGGGPPIWFLPEGGPQPRIVIPSAFYDFGVIGPTSIVKRQFLVRNEGAAPLTISRAYTTCGCTTADFSSRVIPPGKAALVTLVFNAGFHDTRGQVVKRGIIIENNDRDHSRSEIWVRASVSM